MPSDVTVHKPGTRVVGVEGEDEETALASGTITRHESHITTRRVHEVQSNAAIVGAVTSSQNVEVVSVKMDWVLPEQVSIVLQSDLGWSKKMRRKKEKICKRKKKIAKKEEALTPRGMGDSIMT